MSAHAPHLSEDALRELPASVSRATQRLLLWIGIGTTLISVAGEWSHGHHVLNVWLIEQASTLGAILNLALIVLVLFPSRLQPLSTDAHDLTVRRAAQCLNAYCLPALTWFWRLLGLVYVVLLYRYATSELPHQAVNLSHSAWPQKALPDILVEILSAADNFCLFLAFGSLTPKFLLNYINDPDAANRPWAAVRKRNRLFKTEIFWASLLAALPTLGLAILVHSLSPVSANPEAVSKAAVAANGVASAVALALLVGRLDSKFVLNWQWAIPLLYAYCGIQVYSSSLHANLPMEKAAYIYSAFTLKCVLFIFLSNLFERGRILYFAVEVYEFQDRSV